MLDIRFLFYTKLIITVDMLRLRVNWLNPVYPALFQNRQIKIEEILDAYEISDILINN